MAQTYAQTLSNIVRHINNNHPGHFQAAQKPQIPLNEQTSIKMNGGFESPGPGYSRYLKRAMEKSLALEHKLDDFVIQMPGMSGRKYRYFINNLIEMISEEPAHAGARYLEVGSWKGSTACSAMYKNNVGILCIDNWTGFGGPRTDFMANINKSISRDIDFNLLDEDFRKVDYTDIGKFNVYLFDGPHEEVDQYDGVMHALPALDDEFILIVDDYNLERVIKGTERAIHDAKLNVISSIEIYTTTDRTGPTYISEQYSDWHNGYFIAVCQQTK